jgi:transposase
MSGRKRKVYSQQFRQDAVQLLADSGRPITEVARELGIDKTTLRYWKRKLSGEVPKGRKLSQEEEIRALRQENARLRMEQEVLKKAVVFFANDES